MLKRYTSRWLLGWDIVLGWDGSKYFERWRASMWLDGDQLYTVSIHYACKILCLYSTVTFPHHWPFVCNLGSLNQYWTFLRALFQRLPTTAALFRFWAAEMTSTENQCSPFLSCLLLFHNSVIVGHFQSLRSIVLSTTYIPCKIDF